MKVTTPVRLALVALVVTPLAALAFAQGASATGNHHPSCPTKAVEVDSIHKPSPCPTGSPSASVSASVSVSPSKSASVSPSVSATASPRVTESASGTAHRTVTPSVSPGTATLPVTGTSGTIALVGLGLVLVGGVAILVSRMRRKVSFVVE